MNILITGSNGFVGSTLVKLCKAKYHTIGSGRSKENTGGADEYVAWDMGKEECPELLRKQPIDVIVHAAASLDMNSNSEELIYTNCLGAHRIFTLAQQVGCKCLISISSIPIVGEPVETITEKSALNPKSMYHATKAFQEMLFNQMQYMHPECRVINLRIPSPIGPGQPVKTIVPIFVRKALNGETITLAGAGTRRQNYVDVRDICAAIELLIQNPEASGTFNIGSDNPVSNYDLAVLCANLAGAGSEITFSGKPDPTDTWVWDVDTSKLKAAVGYKARYTIRDTIADMIQSAKES